MAFNNSSFVEGICLAQGWRKAQLFDIPGFLGIERSDGVIGLQFNGFNLRHLQKRWKEPVIMNRFMKTNPA